MAEKRHDANTILAFNFILPIVARKHSKLISLVSIGKKTRISTESRLPEATERAVRKLMTEYAYPQGSIDAAIHRAVHLASENKAESTAMKLSPTLFYIVFFTLIISLLLYFVSESLRLPVIVLFLALLAFLMLREPQYHRIRQISRFARKDEKAQYDMLVRMLDDYRKPAFQLNIGRIILLIIIGAVLILTKDIVPFIG